MQVRWLVSIVVEGVLPLSYFVRVCVRACVCHSWIGRATSMCALPPRVRVRACRRREQYSLPANVGRNGAAANCAGAAGDVLWTKHSAL